MLPEAIEGIPADAGTSDVSGTSFFEYGARFGGGV